jgi:cytochrome c biogenesis protein CcmG, thiol:disulfide interchange protein DsbE
MSRRTVMWILGGVAVVILVVGLLQSGGSSGSDKQAADAAARPYDTAAEQQAALRGAPAPLARLHQEAGTIDQGGKRAYERTIASVKGYPAVVNKWASWCGPCRAEFPIFQAASSKLGKRVAFLGLNSSDNLSDAKGFLADRPVPYPSIEDPSDGIARSVDAGGYWPITVFYGPDGKRTYTHAGPYRTLAALESDIRRYGS